MNDTKDIIFDAASLYQQLGFSLWPWRGASRDPILKSIVEYRERLPTEDEINTWFRNTNNNIAIITGKISNLLVIDIDIDANVPDHHPLSKHRMFERQSYMTDTGCIAESGSGGLHYYYKYPKGLGHINNAVNLFGCGVDIKADGGMIDAPPSIHHKTKKRYQWFKFAPDFLAEPPEWIFGDSPPDWSNKLGFKQQSRSISNDENWLSNLIEHGVEEGGRNDALAKMVGYFAGIDMIYDIALKLCLEWNNKLCRPMPEKEVISTVSSVYKTHRRRNPATTIADTIPLPNVPEQEPSQVDKLPMLSLGEMITQHDKETMYIVDDWLPEASIAFAISKPQCFKSFLSFDLATSIATGKPFLGKFPVNKTGKVFIFQQEDSYTDMLNRISLMIFSKFDNLDIKHDEEGFEIPFIRNIEEISERIQCHDQHNLRLDDEQAMLELDALIDKHRPILVIIDPLYLAVGLDDFMLKASQNILHLRRMRDKYKTSFLIVHHNKSGIESWSRDSMWGSQLMAASIETCWLIRRNPSAPASIIKRHFKGSGERNLVQVTFDIQSERTPWRYGVDCEEISENNAEELLKAGPDKEDMEDEIITILRNKEMTIADLAHELKIGREVVLDNLFNLKKKKRVKKRRNDMWVGVSA